VGLIEDQQRLFAFLAQPVAQWAGVGLIAHQGLAEESSAMNRLTRGLRSALRSGLS
jgi:hypothetical protein